jgi:hypothetical protein
MARLSPIAVQPGGVDVVAAVHARLTGQLHAVEVPGHHTQLHVLVGIVDGIGHSGAETFGRLQREQSLKMEEMGFVVINDWPEQTLNSMSMPEQSWWSWGRDRDCTCWELNNKMQIAQPYCEQYAHSFELGISVEPDWAASNRASWMKMY